MCLLVAKWIKTRCAIECSSGEPLFCGGPVIGSSSSSANEKARQSPGFKLTIEF